MKLVQISFQFQYGDAIRRIVDGCGVAEWVMHPMIDGRDREGRHDGSKAFPGNMSLVQAEVADEDVDVLFERLEAFRQEKSAHLHLVARVLPVERGLGQEGRGADARGPGAGGEHGRPGTDKQAATDPDRS